MKKTLSIAIMATMIIAAFSGCGCEKTNTSTTKSTNDEAATHVEVVTEVATDEQGNTYYEETTVYVSDTTVQTATDADKAEEDTTSPTAAVENSTSKAESKTTSNVNNGSKQTSSSAANNNSSKSTETSSANTNNSSSSSKSNSGSSNSNSGNSSSNSSSNKSNSGSSSQSSAADPHAGKIWHEAVYKSVYHPAETKEVKVVDQEAYSYEEPVYEWRTFCNVCGADITENCFPHIKQHMLANEGGRYHDDYVQVDTRTVNVPEQSHIETVVVKDAWTEQVLVKEAGWY